MATSRASEESSGHGSSHAPSATIMIQLGPQLWLDLEAASIIVGPEEILLTPHEYRVLSLLAHAMLNGRGYLTASALAEQIVSQEAYDPEHAIEDTISNIRRKLGEQPYAPVYLVSRRAIGYRLRPQLA